MKKNDGQFLYFILKTSLFEEENLAKLFAKHFYGKSCSSILDVIDHQHNFRQTS